VQFDALRRVPGFENCKFFRPGYAIEYDYFPPTQLKFTLETKLIENLYFAGQINGTTGYEEAACQGLMAGINAHRKTHELEPVILKRSDAYIGVLIDDLINKGTDEPYRMFTSRAEYRTILRQDNADLRLTALGHHIGLAKEDRMRLVEEKINQINHTRSVLKSFPVEPKEVDELLIAKGSSPLNEKTRAEKVLLRPNIGLKELVHQLPNLAKEINCTDELVLEQVEIQTKYEVYIEKEKELVHKMAALEDLIIPDSFNYEKLSALSAEAKQKFIKIRPRTLGQASRISGVNPSDVQILMVYMGR
jgi:tRNA uridine 5-carboxymethylaminomethyl modification enzyme